MKHGLQGYALNARNKEVFVIPLSIGEAFAPLRTFDLKKAEA
jgi:hypothetical protein